MLSPKNLYSSVDSLAVNKWFVYLFPLFCIVAILFFNCPYYEGIIKEPSSTWILVFKQAAVVFPDTSQLDPSSHDAKMTFRLAIPMLIKLFSLRSRFVVYGLQLVVAWFFFYFTRALFFKILKDGPLSFVLTLAIAFIYAGQQFVTDIYAKFDCFALFFILLAMYYNNALAIFIGVSLALWVDERGGLMSLFIIPWVLMNRSTAGEPKKSLLREAAGLFDLRIIAYFLALILYLVTRSYLQHKFGVSAHINDIHLRDLISRKNIAFFGLWGAFEGLWLVVLFSALCFFIGRDYFLLLILAFITGLVCFAAFIVADITRSMTYLFPLLIISIYNLAKQPSENKPVLIRIIAYGFLICFLVPSYYTEGNNLILKSSPVIFRILG